LIHGEGITSDELREAIRRLLERRKNAGRGEKPDHPLTPVINEGLEESFAPITQVEPVSFDPAAHASYAQAVARYAAHMREYFHRMGLRMVQHRMRVQGRSLDRARLLPAVLRSDPRMLIARNVKMETDLFLGLLIDCSGSMQIARTAGKGKTTSAL